MRKDNISHIRWTKQGCLRSQLLFNICMLNTNVHYDVWHLKKKNPKHIWLGDCSSAPSEVSQFLEKAKGSAASMPLICKLINSEPNLLYLAGAPRRQNSSALIIPGPGTRQLVTTPIAQSLLKLFKLTNFQLFTLPCLVFPAEIPIKF